MSQNNILELLSVTNNAVKALDRSQSSKYAGSSGSTSLNEKKNNAENQPPVDHLCENGKSSVDSGVGKTNTRSSQAADRKEKSTPVDESDDSTTASDILIRSTVIDTSTNGKPTSLNSSASSQRSGCNEHENINVPDTKKVKIMRKHLREIVSPRDLVDDVRYPSQNSNVGVINTEACLNKNNHRLVGKVASEVDIHKFESGKVNKSFHSKAHLGISKKCLSGNESESSKTESLRKSRIHNQGTGTMKQQTENKEQETTSIFLPIAGQTLEAENMNPDFPSGKLLYKISRHDGSTVEQVFVDPEEQPEDEEDKQSETSSQPEIVTVPERLVNISSQALTVSDSEDSVSQGSVVEVVLAADSKRLPSHQNPKRKPQHLALRQGALMQGQAVCNAKAEKENEVQISKFSLTDKERELREALAKRGNHSKPVKRVIHPKMICSSTSDSGDSGLNKNNNMDTEGGVGDAGVRNVDSITAAVAASAAVAATQPFLRLQQEMETKMQSLLAEIERAQKQIGATGAAELSDHRESDRRIEHLEQQVKELSDKRLQHLEVLQSQQMEVQAHLLSMSRDARYTRHQRQPNLSQQLTYFPNTISQPLTADRQGYNRALIERELMKGRLQGDTANYIQESAGGGYKKQEESAFDTPNPRSQRPRPAEFNSAKGGLLQEILAAEPSPQLNTTFNLPHGQVSPPRPSSRPTKDGGSPVEKARKLVMDLSRLEDRTAESLGSDLKSRTRSIPKPEEPAPLDQYLKRVHDPSTTPYSKLGKSRKHRDASPSKSISGKESHITDAPVQDRYGEARSVLHSVVAERETLEKNLEWLLRSQQDIDVYSLMGAASADRSEIARIQKMVEKRISTLKDEVKHEVEWDMQHNVATVKSSSLHDFRKKPSHGVTTKSTVGFGSGAPRMSRTDIGLRKSQSISDPMSITGRGKKGIQTKMAPKAIQKSKIPYEDEGVMTQIYGKAQYQKGRTTVRDPYLHFQNESKARASRIPSPKRVDSAVYVKSSKTQAGGDLGTDVYSVATSAHTDSGAPRQFYFSPTRGYVPLSCTSAAPVEGQLVPMAVPLGKPRFESGLAVAHGSQPYPMSTALPVSNSIRPLVTAATNVAMVAMTTDDTAEERVPELGKQVLPAVDIDSISPASSLRSSDIQIKDPDTSQNVGYLQTFHYQENEQEDEDRTLTEQMSDEEQQGTGFSLPGHHQPTPAREAVLLKAQESASRAAAGLRERTSQLREHGQVPWEERSDELAEDLRTRDILHNKAKYWLEQELMARMLMKMYPVMSAQAGDQQEEDADQSESIPDDESLMVVDTIGQKGLQLFVDAGQPVNNNLVNALVREVIAERVGNMLGRRQEADSADAGSIPTARKTADGARDDTVLEAEFEFVQPQQGTCRVPTPLPTPCTSPVPGYVSHQAPATPPLTPPHPPLPSRDRSPVESSVPVATLVSAATSMTPTASESETEISASMDISEELRVLDEKVRSAPTPKPHAEQFQHDVATPTATPPPPPQPAQEQPTVTPIPSPPPLPQEELVQDAVRKPVSSGPKFNPTEEEADTVHVQPRPLKVSVAIGPEVGKQRRSPSPKQRGTASVDQSELDSVSSSSSITDTVNENISEGQWLISRSEGQVAGLPFDNDAYRIAAAAARKADISTASTLRDAEDLDLENVDISQSEGEFVHKGDIINPETDPVLALLMQMQHHPSGFHQFDLPAHRLQQVLGATGHSAGEVRRTGALGNGIMRKSVGDLSEGQVLLDSRVTMVTPKQALPSPQEEETSDRRMPGSVEIQDRGNAATHDRSSVNPNRPRPRRRMSPGPRSGQQPYQPVISGPPGTHRQQPLKSALMRSSEESRYSQDSEKGSDKRDPPTDHGTQSLNSVQLNTENMLQTGGSSGHQGSTKKSVEFDLSPYEISHRESPIRRSEDRSVSPEETSDRLSRSGQSLGLRYSSEDISSENGVGSSQLRMSVKIPTTDGGSESDASSSTGF